MTLVPIVSRCWARRFGVPSATSPAILTSVGQGRSCARRVPTVEAGREPPGSRRWYIAEMATFTVGCRCGEQFHVDESAIGRRIACRRCGSLVEVVRPPDTTTGPSRPSGRSSRRKENSKAPPSAHRIIIPHSRGSRVLGIVALAYLAAVALIAAVMWGLGDRSVVGTVLLFMGRWVVLLPLVVLLPAALWLRRSSLFPLALAALIGVGPIMGLRTGWRRLLPTPAGTQLRVVTHNA